MPVGHRPARETALSLSNSVLDTRFRSALGRMADRAACRPIRRPSTLYLEVAGMMKKLDGGPALLFSKVNGHDMPVIGNLLSCQANVEAAFGADFRGVRKFVGRALGDPKPPVLVERAPAQEQVHTKQHRHRENAAGAAAHRRRRRPLHHRRHRHHARPRHRRLQRVLSPADAVPAPNRAAIQLDFGRHLRAAFERAQKKGQHLPVVVCIGSDLALQYTAATMGSQMPENADELAVAGGLCGRALPVVKAITQDLLVPAETEIVLEGVLNATRRSSKARSASSSAIWRRPTRPDAGDHRDDAPREADLSRHQRLRPRDHDAAQVRAGGEPAQGSAVAVPIVTDAEMTAGGLHRFHAVVQVKKTGPTHDGFQRNAIMASFGALKDLDMVIVVDDDIDIRDPADVEYALATRMEASKDIFMLPARAATNMSASRQRHAHQARHRRDRAVHRQGALRALRVQAGVRWTRRRCRSTRAQPGSGWICIRSPFGVMAGLDPAIARFHIQVFRLNVLAPVKPGRDDLTSDAAILRRQHPERVHVRFQNCLVLGALVGSCLRSRITARSALMSKPLPFDSA